MSPIVLALRHPYAVLAAVVGLACASLLAVSRMKVDGLPSPHPNIICIAQPCAGMDPTQIEGHVTQPYELQFLAINGIQHIESKSIPGLAQIKLYFQPGTDMAQALAETIGSADRARASMPPGMLPPVITRLDGSSAPVGFLVFSSETRSAGQVQDEVQARILPMVAALPGVAPPAAFGRGARAVVVRADPERLRAYSLSLDDLSAAIHADNQVRPAGTVTIGDKTPIVAINSVVSNPKELGHIVLFGGEGEGPAVCLRDVAAIEDTTEAPTGLGLINGHRAVFVPVTRRADASPLDAIDGIKANLDEMQQQLSSDVKVRFELDQAAPVTRILRGAGLQAILGALLAGLIVAVFLRDWRGAIVVALSVSSALFAVVFALGLGGQTINLMTLAGLALSVGLLVNEATVTIEGIHGCLDRTGNVARAVLRGTGATAWPRLLAALCVVTVFVPAFFLPEAASAIFLPLALTVCFAMLASSIFCNTLVPVLSVWLLRRTRAETEAVARPPLGRLQVVYAQLLHRLAAIRWLLLPGYLLLCAFGLGFAYRHAGRELLPPLDSGQLTIRLHAPEGTSLESTEALVRDVLDAIGDEVGRDRVDVSVSHVGSVSSHAPMNSVFLWTAGPHDAVLRMALKPDTGIRMADLKERLRRKLPLVARAKAPLMKDVKLRFEADDATGLGSPMPIEVVVSGPNLPENRVHAERLRKELERIPALRDVHYAQSLDYPTLEISVDREKAGLSRATSGDVARAFSSRFTRPTVWRDPRSGIAYPVQVEVPASRMDSVEALGTLPIKKTAADPLLVRDVAELKEGTMPGEVDRHDMRRLVSLTANRSGEDLGRLAEQIERAIDTVGKPPRGMRVDLRGQVTPMREMFHRLALGLGPAVLVIFLLLTAYFQSIRLALLVVLTVPAALTGSALMLLTTGTSLNIQSILGAIVATGAALASAILLVTCAERRRREGIGALGAAVECATLRLRLVLMSSAVMIACVLPMAVGPAAEALASLAWAVIGGLIAAAVTTLFVLPGACAAVQHGRNRKSASLDPGDARSPYFEADAP
ncbi:MAG: efflux RND transporter permease subunit [Gemmataceae bacterium]|nr:efflux RND transporter permease subunit [Gemmataceae bacterium]